MLNIGLIEDHRIVADGFRAAVQARPDLALSIVAERVEDFVNRRPVCDVVVMDLGLPGGIDGPQAVRFLTDLGHRVVVLSAREDRIAVDDSFTAGAWAYVCKRSGPDELLDVVAAVGNGERPAVRVIPDGLGRDAVLLTHRQREVLGDLAQGRTNADIASSLSISLSAVKRHVEELMRRTGRHTRAGLASWAIEEPGI